jgi:hypothetical protein
MAIVVPIMWVDAEPVIVKRQERYASTTTRNLTVRFPKLVRGWRLASVSEESRAIVVEYKDSKRTQTELILTIIEPSESGKEPGIKPKSSSNVRSVAVRDTGGRTLLKLVGSGKRRAVSGTYESPRMIVYFGGRLLESSTKEGFREVFAFFNDWAKSSKRVTASQVPGRGK